MAAGAGQRSILKTIAKEQALPLADTYLDCRRVSVSGREDTFYGFRDGRLSAQKKKI